MSSSSSSSFSNHHHYYHQIWFDGAGLKIYSIESFEIHNSTFNGIDRNCNANRNFDQWSFAAIQSLWSRKKKIKSYRSNLSQGDWFICLKDLWGRCGTKQSAHTHTHTMFAHRNRFNIVYHPMAAWSVYHWFFCNTTHQHLFCVFSLCFSWFHPPFFPCG